MTEFFTDVADPVAAAAEDPEPQPVSGRQEWLENQVSRVIWSTR
jgi:hypothetical protein